MIFPEFFFEKLGNDSFHRSDVVVVAPKALRLFYRPTKGSTETLFYIEFFGASGGTSAQPRRRVVVRDPLLPPQLYLSIRLPRACVRGVGFYQYQLI